MGKSTKPGAIARREPLSRERVLLAGLSMADADGLAALTVRGLARRLEVEPMSLYHYADSREDIVAALVELVVEQIEVAPPGGDWKAAIRTSAISAHRVLREHPWACARMMSAPRPSPGRLRMIDALLARLEEAELGGELLDLTYHAIDSHILGFTLWEAGYASGMPALAGGALETFLREIRIDDYPHLEAHARWHLAPRDGARRDEFEFGLDLILDGVERMRDGWHPPS